MHGLAFRTKDGFPEEWDLDLRAAVVLANDHLWDAQGLLASDLLPAGRAAIDRLKRIGERRYRRQRLCSAESNP